MPRMGCQIENMHIPGSIDGIWGKYLMVVEGIDGTQKAFSILEIFKPEVENPIEPKRKSANPKRKQSRDPYIIHLNIATCKWWCPFILVLKKPAMFQTVKQNGHLLRSPAKGVCFAILEVGSPSRGFLLAAAFC